MSYRMTVIGATGNMIVSGRLLKNGVKVCAVRRAQDNLASLAQQGAEIRAGSLNDVGFITPILPTCSFPTTISPKSFEGAAFSAGVARLFVEMNAARSPGMIQSSVKCSAVNTTATTLEQFAREVFVPVFQQA